MNKILKTTIYLILLSLTSQVSAQYKILFVDKTHFVDSLEKRDRVNTQLDSFRKNNNNKLLDLEYTFKVGYKQLIHLYSYCGPTEEVRKHIEDSLMQINAYRQYMREKFDSLLELKETEFLNNIELEFNFQVENAIKQRSFTPVLDRKFLIFSQNHPSINTGLFSDSIDLSKRTKIAVINKYEILEKLYQKAQVDQIVKSYTLQINAELKQKRERLWDYAAEVACTRCTKIRIEDPNPPLLKELKSAYYEGQQRLYKKQDQTKEKVNVQFDKMVTYLAQERNYTHVLDKSCLFYFDEIRTEDITDKVTEMLGLRE